MGVSKGFKRKLTRSTSIFLTFLLLAVNFLEVLHAIAHAEEPAEKTVENQTIAEWTFPENPTDLGAFPATDGALAEGSTLKAVPERDTTTFSWDSASKSIRYQGWHAEDGVEKYWHATLSTKDFDNITLSSVQQGRGSTGPKDFSVQMSTDGENWTNVTGEGTSLSDLVMISGTPVSLDNASLTKRSQ